MAEGRGALIRVLPSFNLASITEFSRLEGTEYSTRSVCAVPRI